MRSLSSIQATLLATLTISLIGCGGGGGDNSAPAAIQTANAHVTVNWAARTRDIDAPASAQSLIVTLKNASPTGTDVAFTINRDSAPAGYKKSYSSPLLAKVGTCDLNARFFAQANGTGSVVGTIDAQINLAADGTGIGDFATTGAVASVTVAPNQTLPIGVPTDIIFTAKDSGGSDLAISPGSAKITITQGSDKLQIDAQGRANGTAVGTAKVTATVDGKVSPEQDVSVGYVTAISVTPPTVTMFANGRQGFNVSISGLPNQFVNGVIWSVQEGAAGGTVGSGVYIAPSTPGTYHVVATSQYDATKMAVATVTVTGPASANLPGIYVLDQGNSSLIHADDITGAGWGAASTGATGFTIGPDGKIYFAEGSKISRIDNLSGSNRVSFGSSGTTPGHFSDVRSVAVGADGKIYAVDNATRRLIRFDDMSGANWVELNTLNAGFGTPYSVQVAGGQIYFGSDQGIVRINDMQGAGAKQLNAGGGFYVDANGKIYTAGNVQVARYDNMDDHNPVRFGFTQGNGTGQFSGANSVWVAANGQIFVADVNNRRIVRIDDMTGKNWTTLGSLGISNNQFSVPLQIVVR